MKIAAGCFGCLALVFLGLAVAWGFIVTALSPVLADMPPDAAAATGSALAWGSYLNGGCCCLSGLLAVVLLALGMRKGEGEYVE